MRSRRAVPIVAATLLLSSACGPRELGLPRVALRVPSPDGQRAAVVRNHPSIDPPRQSLWLEHTASGESSRLRALGEDVDWCRSAVWSQNGERVAFLVQEAWVAIYRADGTELAVLDVVPRSGYPTPTMALDLRFVADGSRLAFRECDRQTGRDCVERELAASGQRRES